MNRRTESNRRIDQIRPGFYRARVKGGPWYPAEIRIVDGVYTVSECGGKPLHTVRVEELPELFGDQLLAGEAFEHRLLRVAIFGQEIDRATYISMVRTAAWARVHAPDHPAANPFTPIDIAKVAIDTIF